MEKKRLKKLNENQTHRISFAKFLFKEAEKKCRLPNPNDSITILNLHDSVDIYIQLLAEFYNCKPDNKTSLMSTVNSINTKLVELKLEKLELSLFDRLNTARNKLKHETIFLNQIDIFGFISGVKNFYIESTPLYFGGLKFESISLVNLVKSPKVKKCLQYAKKEIENKKYNPALEKINEAFGYIINDITTFKSNQGYRVSVKPSKWFHPISSSYIGNFDKHGIKGFNDFERGLKESFDYLNELIIINNFKVNINDYARFKQYKLYGYMSTTTKFTVVGEYKNKIKENEINFCFDFVLQIALS
ncbi:MAG TPA: hypothetical protein PKH58_09920 [Paludibacteraceae bacterium]|nr:hypothetical protein [Paludibacteraceae bacterium]